MDVSAKFHPLFMPVARIPAESRLRVTKGRGPPGKALWLAARRLRARASPQNATNYAKLHNVKLIPELVQFQLVSITEASG